MEFKTVFDENINDYSDYVDGDVAENMQRLYYRGIAGHDPDDNSLLTLLIWELKSAEDAEKTSAEFKWLYTADPSYISSLLDGYHKEALITEVKKTFFEDPSLDKESENALSGCGFTVKAVEGRNIDVTVDECRRLPLAIRNAPPYVQSIGKLDDYEFYQGIMNILFKDDDPALEDIAYLPKTWYEPTVSCYTKTDGKVTGLLLVHKCPSGILTPVMLFAVGSDARINLVEMMRFSIRQAAETYSADTVIRIFRRNRSVKALSGKLFPGKKGEPAIAGVRAEKEQV